MDPDHRAALTLLARRAASGPLIPVALAILLGLYLIGDKSLWLDEGFSASAARLPTGDLIPRLLFDELHASPYYLSLHPWTGLGTSEAEVRSLSVVYGVVAVLATYLVGKRYGVAFPAAHLRGRGFSRIRPSPGARLAAPTQPSGHDQITVANLGPLSVRRTRSRC